MAIPIPISKLGKTCSRKSSWPAPLPQWSGELQIDYNLADDQSLIAGIQYDDSDQERGYRGTNPDPEVLTIRGFDIINTRATFTERDGVSQDNTGAYLQYSAETRWLRATNFTLGIRYDENSTYGDTTNPRLGIVNKPNDRLTLKLLYGSAFRAPSVFELYGSSPVRIANPELKPEENKTYEFGVGYRLSSAYLQANFFVNRLTSLIVNDVPIGNGLGSKHEHGNS